MTPSSLPARGGGEPLSFAASEDELAAMSTVIASAMPDEIENSKAPPPEELDEHLPVLMRWRPVLVGFHEGRVVCELFVLEAARESAAKQAAAETEPGGEPDPEFTEMLASLATRIEAALTQGAAS